MNRKNTIKTYMRDIASIDDEVGRMQAGVDVRQHQTPLVTINSWNEWTEGRYLLPDMRWGYGYLRTVRNIFGSSRKDWP